MDVRVVTTDETRRLEESSAAVKSAAAQEFDVVNLYPTRAYQQLIGFGGAVTQTVAELYWGLPEDARTAFLRDHFSAEGRNYRLVRTPVQSCDFGPGPHSYVKHFWQSPKRAFDLSIDEQHVIPMLQDIAAFNPQVEFLITPWSPPAFMKTNHMMRFGGHLKSRYENRWAYIVARYAYELRKRGIPVTRLTVQNEPRARQVWESCLVDAAQEARLARALRKHLASFGIDDIKILAWDHNKERLLDRMDESREAQGEAGNPFDGWAFHWYTGDHFEALAAAAESADAGELIMTEGCEFFATDAVNRRAFAEHYAHDIIGDLNAGAHAWIDWNMMLDAQGGPTYVRNFCSAPVQAVESAAGENAFETLPSAIYIEHFSRFIEPGARRILTTSFTADLEATAWKNPDGSLVCVILNRRDQDMHFHLRAGESMASLKAPAHSIQTVVWRADAQA